MQLLFQSLEIIKAIPRWAGKLLSENDNPVEMEERRSKNFEWFFPTHMVGTEREGISFHELDLGAQAASAG